MPITINSLLQNFGLNLSEIKFARHAVANAPPGRTPFDLWRTTREGFELYQRIQGNPVLNRPWLASFVRTPTGETLYVGCYQVGTQIDRVPSGTLDPVSGNDVTGLYYYNLALSNVLQEYIGRIVIDWGGAAVVWLQNADAQPKDIVEIRRQEFEPPFPGFDIFRYPINKLTNLPSTWKAVLSSIKGCYLLTEINTGKMYVGSAYGDGGFLSRWMDYYNNGNGGNVRMADLTNANYYVSILEVASSVVTYEQIIQSEMKWIEKLQTRQFGLNS